MQVPNWIGPYQLLISWGYCNKSAQTWFPKITEIYSFPVLEARSLQSVPLGWNQGNSRVVPYPPPPPPAQALKNSFLAFFSFWQLWPILGLLLHHSDPYLVATLSSPLLYACQISPWLPFMRIYIIALREYPDYPVKIYAFQDS